jgi:hypothetical protein
MILVRGPELQSAKQFCNSQRAERGAEPGGGAGGPHRDAPSRVGCGGKKAEDCVSP